jgi:exodeoxyribonuclease VII small subunit
MPKVREKEPGFEESLSSLERIVAQLESGDLPIERALEIFEEGISLARRCQSQLDDAERKVEILLRERGAIKTIPFDPRGETVSSSATVSSLSPPALVSAPSRVQPDELETDEEITDESIPF